MWTALICWIVFIVAGGIYLLFGVERSIPNEEMGILCALMYLSAAMFFPWRALLSLCPVPRKLQSGKTTGMSER